VSAPGAVVASPRRGWLVGASIAVAIGAGVHLAALVGGPSWLAAIGAPLRLVQMAEAGALRPLVTTAAIAGVLLLMSAYGMAAAGVLRWRLPFVRLVLAAFGAGLVVRALVLPAIALWRPHLLQGICGRCESLDGFVGVTSALCLGVGAIYFAAALRAAPIPPVPGQAPAGIVR
jgi:hypothetical protein